MTNINNWNTAFFAFFIGIRIKDTPKPSNLILRNSPVNQTTVNKNFVENFLLQLFHPHSREALNCPFLRNKTKKRLEKKINPSTGVLITREQNTGNLQRLAHTVKCAGTKEERDASLTIRHPVIEKRYCRVSFSN